MAIGTFQLLPSASVTEICCLVAERLGVDNVTSETHFVHDLGADFLDLVELSMALEDRFTGMEITDDDIEQMQVVGDLIRYCTTQPN